MRQFGTTVVNLKFKSMWLYVVCCARRHVIIFTVILYFKTKHQSNYFILSNDKINHVPGYISSALNGFFVSHEQHFYYTIYII